MSYVFTTSQEGDMLVVRIGGTRPALDIDAIEQMWAFWSRTGDQCHRQGIRRLLSVNTPSGAVTSSAAATFYKRLGEFGLDPRMRIAVVIPDSRSRRVIELGAALAVERGWNVRVFAEEDPARQWLLLD
jgi:hypothetical protein